MTTISFLGCGNMAGALLRALLVERSIPEKCSSNFVKSIKTILIFDPFFNSDSNNIRSKFLEELNKLSLNSVEIKFVETAIEAAERCEVGIIGVKPQFAQDALLPVRGHWGAKSKSSKSIDQPTIIVSMLAGTSIRSLERLLVDPAVLRKSDSTPTHLVIARLMPNIGAVVRHGSSGYSIDAINIARAIGDCAKQDKIVRKFTREVVEGLFGCAGFIAEIPEKMFDAVTAMQGLPAWTAMFIEAAADGGVACGLPRPLAKRFAAEIVFGSGALLSGDKPAFKSSLDLKEAVCSPGGTTIRGVAALEQRKFRSAVIEAVLAANKRAEDMKKAAEENEKEEEKGMSRMSKL